jgi:3-hydroxyisobutyrate dehydrogenase-like beta-hydroxyacid dehydrogenase
MSRSTGAATVGVVGLGLVGRALAARAIAGGYAVTGFDVSPAAAGAAEAIGVAVAADLPQLLAECTVAVVCVFDDAQLGDVVAEIDAECARRPGVAHAIDRGIDLAINTATCSPPAVEAAAAALGRHGIAFMELPLSGSSAQIRDGTALGLIGAEAATLARYQPLVTTLSPRHVHVGLPGSAARAKLASNLILGLNRAALAEGLALAERLGLDGLRFLEILRDSPAYSRAVDTVGARMVARDFAPQSRLAQHRKDLSLILAQAAGVAQELPLAQAHAALLDRAIAMGLGDADNAAVIAALAPRSARPGDAGQAL